MTLDHDLLNNVSNKIGSILKTEKRERTDFKCSVTEGPAYDPIDISPTDKETIDYVDEMGMRFDLMMREEKSIAIKEMLTRAVQNILKMATCHAVGNFRSVTIPDLKWAEQTWLVSLHNSMSVINEGAADSEWEKDLEKICSLFKKKGSMTKAALTKAMKRKPLVLKSLVDHLIASELIVETKTEKKKLPQYTWNA